MKQRSRYSRFFRPAAGVFLFGVLALILSGCKERVAIRYDNPSHYYSSDVSPYGNYYHYNTPGYNYHDSRPYYQPFYYYNTPRLEHYEFGEHHFGGEHFRHHGHIFRGEHGGRHWGHHHGDDDD